MHDPTTAELLDRVEALERELAGRQTRQPSLRSRPRRMIAVLAAIVLVAVPTAILASHNFTDVPDSNTFHNDISDAYGARITAGCGGGNYCPTANVTRGQMAAFLARTGGRVAFDGPGGPVGPIVNSSTPVILASVTIQPGNVSGGTVFVQLIGTATTFTNSATGLPTYGFIYIRRQGAADPVNGAVHSWQIDALAGAYGSNSVATIGVDTVPSATPRTYELVAYRAAGTSAPTGYGNLTASYFPFSGDGDATMSLPVKASEHSSSNGFTSGTK